MKHHIKTLSIWILTATLVCSARAQNARNEYRWTDIQGRTMSAEFVDLEGGILTLRSGGRLVTVQIARLSAQSAGLARGLDARTDQPGLNSAVLSYCRGRIGRHVGDGQCTSVATHALAAAGAAGMSRDFPNPGDYVWGTFVTMVSVERSGVKGIPSLAQVRGGDIIQMRNVLLEGRGPTGGTYWMQANHHTAVVESVNPARGTINILHQNWGGGPVQRDVFVLGDLKRGWMRIYRPAKKR
jgi:hypothetical protein